MLLPQIFVLGYTSAIVLGNTIEPTTLIGFDCSSPHANYTPVDLTTITECENTGVIASEEKVNVQVIQSKLYRAVHVRSCMVHLIRLVYYCGMHSHISAKGDMIYSGLKMIGSSRCEELHRTGSFQDTGIRVSDIKPNSTTVVPLTIAGEIAPDGKCQNVKKYQDIGGSYENVVVTGQMTISVSDYTALAEINGQRLIVQRTGIACKIQNQYCFDHHHGELFWTFKDQYECDTDSVDVLYEGEAIIGTIAADDRILVVKSEDYAFAVRLTTGSVMCNVDVWKTEHDRIFIAEKGHLGYKFSRGKLITANIDLTSYINTKFSYLVYHLRTNIQQLYNIVKERECETRRMVLEHRLILANNFPDRVGALIEGSGVYGRVLGESLYIIRCAPVGVTLRYDSKCYHELPVTYMNNTVFLTPVTRLIVDRAQEVPCRSLIYPQFQIGGKWYIRTPDLMKVNPPNKLNPNDERLLWEFQPLVGISTGGLYSQEQLRSLQKDMMFPAIRDAIQTDIIRKITHTGGDGFNPSDLWSPDQLQGLTDTIAGKISWVFGVFGHYASIVIGCYMCWKLAAYIFGVVINCKILKEYKTGTCCMWASLIDSLTTLLTVHKTTREGIKGTQTKGHVIDDDPEACRMCIKPSGQSSEDQTPTAPPLVQYPKLQPWKIRSSNFM